jgi:hypothetical protein
MCVVTLPPLLLSKRAAMAPCEHGTSRPGLQAVAMTYWKGVTFQGILSAPGCCTTPWCLRETGPVLGPVYVVYAKKVALPRCSNM